MVNSQKSIKESHLCPSEITIERYNEIPEESNLEVYDGFIRSKTSLSQEHQTILIEISCLLNIYLKAKRSPKKVFFGPFDVKLSDRPLIIVKPDIMIISDVHKLGKTRCNGAPDCIIEIVSPNSVIDDYIKKFYYYKKYKVCEYWIVDYERKVITVNYFDGNLLNMQYNFYSKIKVNILSDLYIDFSKIITG